MNGNKGVKEVKMGLFSKKKDKEQEKAPISIPQAPSSMLKFPEMGEIKRAVSKPEPMGVEKPIELAKPVPLEMPKLTQINPSRQMIHMAPAETATPRNRMIIREIDEERESPRETFRGMQREEMPASSRIKEPIFVKIEKFEDALANFEEIKKRMHESFELLDKIKRTRGKEEEEIDAWEKEIEEIKSKILDIDKKLFSRVEF